MKMLTPSDFEGLDWLSTIEAAIYIRALKKDGTPCPERIRNLVSQKKLKSHKPFGRLLFNRSELNKIIETSRLG